MKTEAVLQYYLNEKITDLWNDFFGTEGMFEKYIQFLKIFSFNSDNILCKKDIKKEGEILSLDTYCLGGGHTDPSHENDNYGALSW